MREIKFRAWVDDTMYDVDGIFFNPDGSVESIIITGKSKKSGLDVFTRLAPEDVILLQYTGLHDKNGKEIYEGDIVQVPCDWDEFGCNAGEIYEVYFGYGGFRLKPKYYPSCRGFYLEDDKTYELLGNIYENPELLEGGDDGRKRSIR